MADMPEPGRQAAHVLLDALTARAGDASDGVDLRNTHLAIRCLA
jgi:hypothetical protein